MGLRAVFGYVGNEIAIAETMMSVLKHLCGGCDNYSGEDYVSCKTCPAGRLVYKCRRYLIEASGFKYEDQMIKELANVARDIEPSPRFPKGRLAELDGRIEALTLRMI